MQQEWLIDKIIHDEGGTVEGTGGFTREMFGGHKIPTNGDR